MDALTAGADIGTMLTGLSVVTATYIWVQKQYREYRERRTITQARNWGGFITPTGINDWLVGLVDEPDLPTGRVVLDVVNRKGEPSANMAQSLSQWVASEGKLSRPPTPAEMAFLRYLYEERGYGKGFPVE